MNIVIYLVLIATVLASGSLVFLIRSDDQKLLKLLLAFSGAFLIGISFLILVPEVFSKNARLAGLFVLLGFLIQLVLELITGGAEHGHKHVHEEGEKAAPWLLLIGLCIHAFLEGMPLVSRFAKEVQHSLVLGIVIHNIPISLTLMGLFLHYGCKKTKAFIYLGIFALMTPLGSLAGMEIENNIAASLDLFFTYSMAVVIGIFLHVSTSILFETEEHHKYNIQKFLTVCLGILVAFGVSLLAH
ncbi:MAG: ZIP family metal transporter [Bacteroidetes bacterium]|nr:ZIP family metal transporter [Bacteroidota bacterium]